MVSRAFHLEYNIIINIAHPYFTQSKQNANMGGLLITLERLKTTFKTLNKKLLSLLLILFSFRVLIKVDKQITLWLKKEVAGLPRRKHILKTSYIMQISAAIFSTTWWLAPAVAPSHWLTNTVQQWNAWTSKPLAAETFGKTLTDIGGTSSHNSLTQQLNSGLKNKAVSLANFSPLELDRCLARRYRSYHDANQDGNLPPNGSEQLHPCRVWPFSARAKLMTSVPKRIQRRYKLSRPAV